MRPSFIAQGLSGILAFIGVWLFLKNYQEMNSANLLVIVFLMSMAIALHGMLHLGQEYLYDYNPLKGKWKMLDEPLRRDAPSVSIVKK